MTAKFFWDRTGECKDPLTAFNALDGSRAKARTLSALAMESATWPASTFEAVSRMSTNRCRRRIKGKTKMTVAASIPMSVRMRKGEYVHNTTATKPSGKILATT